MKIKTVCKHTKHLRMVDMPPKAGVILLGMTNNTYFPEAGPMLAQLEEKRALMEAANLACLDGGRIATAHRKACRKELEHVLDALVAYVRGKSGSDVSMAMSSGFELRKAPLLLPPLETPTHLRATRTEFTGQVELRWAPQHGARNYFVQMLEQDEDGSGTWILLGHTSAAKMTVNGLKSGTYYFFRLFAVSARGSSPMSQIVKSIAA